MKELIIKDIFMRRNNFVNKNIYIYFTKRIASSTILIFIINDIIAYFKSLYA